MRCPKCHYISFDTGERCRNCGYDFSLSVEAPSPDLRIQSDDAPIGPLGDFDLARADPAASAAPPRSAAAAPITTDLPLFTDRPRDFEKPPAAAASGPRPPLSVRRSNPGAPRPRPRGSVDEEPTLDLGSAESASRAEGRHGVGIEESQPSGGAAGIVARLFAASIDTIIMVAVHAAVVYFTLRLCGLTMEEIRVLPPVPMVGFLLLLTGGYFVSFTAAGGQTIGKMAAGIRVVPSVAGADPDADPAIARVPFGTAVLRAAAYLISVVPAGAGLIPALFSAEHRALHDRLADTRVVKA